jgi:hypothetical protein
MVRGWGGDAAGPARPGQGHEGDRAEYHVLAVDIDLGGGGDSPAQSCRSASTACRTRFPSRPNPRLATPLAVPVPFAVTAWRIGVMLEEKVYGSIP